MEAFTFTYPTKVYFGHGVAAQALWQELAKVPWGTVVTYGELAVRVGSPKACRAVGQANHNNPLPIFLPCHRVVGANGSLTGYAGGLDVKQWLLQLEGVL